MSALATGVLEISLYAPIEDKEMYIGGGLIETQKVHELVEEAKEAKEAEELEDVDEMQQVQPMLRSAPEPDAVTSYRLTPGSFLRT